jgi:hypothetical protein
MALARLVSAAPAPTELMGKKISVSLWRQAAESRHDARSKPTSRCGRGLSAVPAESREVVIVTVPPFVESSPSVCEGRRGR